MKCDCVLSCPAGMEPSGCKYNPRYDRIIATMPENCCASDPNREKCRARINDKKQKSTVWIWTSLLSYNLVKYQKYKFAVLKQLVAA